MARALLAALLAGCWSAGTHAASQSSNAAPPPETQCSPLLGFVFVLLWAAQVPQVLVQTSVKWDAKSSPAEPEGAADGISSRRRSSRRSVHRAGR